jgi:hypothetical protein
VRPYLERNHDKKQGVGGGAGGMAQGVGPEFKLQYCKKKKKKTKVYLLIL